MAVWDEVITHQLSAIRATVKQSLPAVPALTTDEQFMGIQFTPGDRVLDKMTGSLGSVVSGTVQHTITAAAPPEGAAAAPAVFALPTPGRKILITVQLDADGVVTRTPADLVPIPSALHQPVVSFGQVE